MGDGGWHQGREGEREIGRNGREVCISYTGGGRCRGYDSYILRNLAHVMPSFLLGELPKHCCPLLFIQITV